MNCALCNQAIKNYNPDLNHLKIDESHAADICLDCTDRFLKWQQRIFAKLFPTSTVKKRYGKKL